MNDLELTLNEEQQEVLNDIADEEALDRDRYYNQGYDCNMPMQEERNALRFVKETLEERMKKETEGKKKEKLKLEIKD